MFPGRHTVVRDATTSNESITFQFDSQYLPFISAGSNTSYKKFNEMYTK